MDGVKGTKNDHQTPSGAVQRSRMNVSSSLVVGLGPFVCFGPFVVNIDRVPRARIWLVVLKFNPELVR